MDDILECFVVESIENLDDVEPLLLGLDTSGEEVSLETVNHIFRAFHTIKGSAGFLQLNHINSLTHEAETLLDQVRMGDLAFRQEHVEILCSVIDLLRALIAVAGETGDDCGFENAVRELAADLKVACNGGIAQPVDQQQSDSAACEATCEMQAGSAGLSSGSSVGQTATMTTDDDSANLLTKTPVENTRKSVPGLENFEMDCCDLLDRFESLLMENEPDMDVVNEAFRLVHNFKGNCGLAGAVKQEQMSHVMETAFDLVREGTVPMNEAFIDACLVVSDSLRDSILTSDGESDTDPQLVDQAIGRLTQLIDSMDQDPSPQPAAPRFEVFDEPEAAMRSAEESVQSSASELPAKAAGSRSKTEKPPGFEGPERDPSVRRVLMVDDDRSIGDTMSFGMTALGWDVTCLASARAAMKALEEDDTIQLVVTDIIMPEIDGLELIHWIHEHFPGLPIVAMTIADDSATLKRLINEGIEHYVEKPVSTEHLSEACDTALKRQRKQQQDIANRMAGESIRPQVSKKKAAKDNIRVDLEKLDAMVDLVGEMVIAEAMLTRFPMIAECKTADLKRRIYNVRRVLHELRNVVMTVRMVPLSTMFRKMVRLVHDVAGKAKKETQLVISGEETEVDKTVIEQIGDPLVHIIRNAVDHGIETPDEREAVGKPRMGTVRVSGGQEGDEVVIQIVDDGKGLDREAILKKGVERGLVGRDQQLSDSEVFSLIFEPGFSTAKAVSDISGRGVGMDVVKKNIDKLGGRVEIRSVKGKGTTFVLHIPLTLAIIDGILIRVADSRFTLPILSVCETLQISRSAITVTPDGSQMLRVRDDFVPVVQIEQLCNVSRPEVKVETELSGINEARPDESMSGELVFDSGHASSLAANRISQTADVDAARTVMSRQQDSAVLMQNKRQAVNGVAIIVQSDDRRVALVCDEIVERIEAVVKKLPEYLSGMQSVSGCTILGDGRVCLILDVQSVIARIYGNAVVME